MVDLLGCVADKDGGAAVLQRDTILSICPTKTLSPLPCCNRRTRGKLELDALVVPLPEFGCGRQKTVPRQLRPQASR